MVRLDRIRLLTFLSLVVLTLGCAARFNPGVVRDEIVLQQGRDPIGVFELNLGRLTTSLIRQLVATPEDDTPFRGLRELQLAVFEAPDDDGPAIDVTRMNTRGWEAIVRVLDADRSGMVLVRDTRAFGFGEPAADATVGDVVFVGAGRRNVVYARLQGELSARLPGALEDVFRDGGPDAVENLLTELGRDDD